MRTTWNIDDDVLEEVKEYARARTMPAGEAATFLLKQSLRKPIGTRVENGFQVFDVPEDSPTLTQEHVQRLIDEL
jgi:hypothetical protein